jgi:hypothetical protein
MEIQFFGANCVKIRNKKVVVTVDDNLESVGLKKVLQPSDTAVYTGISAPTDRSGAFIINGPGEYEISEASIRGIPARSHLDEKGLGSTVYTINIGDWTACVLGHIYPELGDEQLEKIGVVDVLIIPVGGNGFTLDALGAVQMIKKIEPKIVIPTHFADDKIRYEVPQSSLDVFLKEMGVSEPEELDTLTLKDRDIGDKTRVVVLKRPSSS